MNSKGLGGVVNRQRKNIAQSYGRNFEFSSIFLSNDSFFLEFCRFLNFIFTKNANFKIKYVKDQ